jgi:hypothetical protein
MNTTHARTSTTIDVTVAGKQWIGGQAQLVREV